MTIAEKKNVMALRRYWDYLKIRRYYINIEIINVTQSELERITKTREIYLQAFYKNIGFRKWLLETPHECRNPKWETDKDRELYKVAIQLKKDILEWEENGIFKN